MRTLYTECIRKHVCIMSMRADVHRHLTLLSFASAASPLRFLASPSLATARPTAPIPLQMHTGRRGGGRRRRGGGRGGVNGIDWWRGKEEEEQEEEVEKEGKGSSSRRKEGRIGATNKQ